MSTTETPTPTEPQPTGRQCPRCGAPMTDEQEWCLHCGAAVGTRVVAAPGWRAPIVIAGVILAIAAIAVAVAIVTLADDTDQVAQTPPPAATPTPPAAATPSVTATPDPAFTPDPTLPEASGQETPTPAPTATPSATPEATSTPSPSASGAGAAEWPAGKSGWTVVLSSDSSRATAEGKAADFAADGIADVGVLNSDDFSSLKGGFWVVFSGEYDNQSDASDALDGIDAKDAYIRRIVPN